MCIHIFYKTKYYGKLNEQSRAKSMKILISNVYTQFGFKSSGKYFHAIEMCRLEVCILVVKRIETII